MPATLDPQLLDDLRTLIRRDLKLSANAAIEEDMPFVGGESDLDSLDLLLLVGSIEKRFGVRIGNEPSSRSAFKNVRSLAEYVQERRPAAIAPSATSAAPPTPPRTAPDLNAAIAHLPHGPGFRFVTRVEALEVGVSGRAAWELSGREPFFADHFPGRPLVPGVLLIEALAQTAGLVATGAAVNAADGAPRGGMLVHADIRFRQPVAPPATIALEARLSNHNGPLHVFECVATVAGQVVAEGALSLRLT